MWVVIRILREIAVNCIIFTTIMCVPPHGLRNRVDSVWQRWCDFTAIDVPCFNKGLSKFIDAEVVKMFGLRLVILTTLVVVLIVVLPVSARDMSTKDLLTEIDNRLQNKVAKQEAIDAGRERAALCKSCHGEDGNSVKPDVPNLAGQNAAFLLEQINQFANGQRIDFVMNQLAKNFSTEDKINLAIYYNSVAVKPQHVNWHLANKGEDLYKSRCSGCHGEKGLGHDKLARIAGQQVEYVKNALTKFRNAAANISIPTESQRTSVSMERVAKNLTDEQIEVLAHFVAQLGIEFD